MTGAAACRTTNSGALLRLRLAAFSISRSAFRTWARSRSNSRKHWSSSWLVIGFCIAPAPIQFVFSDQGSRRQQPPWISFLIALELSASLWAVSLPQLRCSQHPFLIRYDISANGPPLDVQHYETSISGWLIMVAPAENECVPSTFDDADVA